MHTHHERLSSQRGLRRFKNTMTQLINKEFKGRLLFGYDIVLFTFVMHERLKHLEGVRLAADLSWTHLAKRVSLLSSLLERAAHAKAKLRLYTAS